MNTKILLAAAIAAGLAIPAFAGVTYDSMSRSIQALAGVPPISVADAVSGFAPYDGYVEIYGHNPDGTPDSFGFAGQHSYVNDDLLHFEGDVGGTDAYAFGGVGAGLGDSTFVAVFTVTGPDTEWHLDIALSGTFSRTTQYQFAFERLAPSPETFFEVDTFGPTTLSDFGDLTAGTYRLSGYTKGGWGGAASGSGHLASNVTLTIPGPGAGAALGLAGLTAARRRRRG